MAERLKWNVSAGTYTSGKGQPFNRDYRTETGAKRAATLAAKLHPEWQPTIRKMKLIPFPGFGQAWMEQTQYPWPS